MDDRRIWQSQNFLKRPEFAESLIDKTDINTGDLVVEIGPGKGIITQQLAKKADKLIAVEVDSRYAENLRNTYQSSPKINIVEADFLKWQLPEARYKVFSNIPFNMTADIVKKLTEDKNPPEKAYLIMQDKAALRFIGKPKENQISILTKPWFNINILTNIDKREFVPVPKINAVLAKFEKRINLLIEEKYRNSYRDFVVYGFNQWQPTVMDSFKEIFTSKQRNIIEKDLSIKGLKPSDLKLETWFKLFERFNTFVPNERKEIIKSAEEKLERQQKSLKKWHRTR